MPPITVEAPKAPAAKRASSAPAQAKAPPTPGVKPDPNAPTAQQAALDQQMKAMDQARENLLPKAGASSYTIGRDAIEAQPQGENVPIDKMILQAPGVAQDTAASNPDFHIRSDVSSAQYRINGVMLPDGVSGFATVIDGNFASSVSLLTGTLPAQYGLRTAGVIDVTSRTFAAPEGVVSLYGGSHGTFTPSIAYGGSSGDTQYFFSGRGNWNSVGIENPTPAYNAIHDETQQGKFFGYLSKLIDPSTRLSVISGASYGAFQIPNYPGQVPLGDFPVPFNSVNLNENQYERYLYDLAMLQTKGSVIDTQLAVYYRYANVHFFPDIPGDLVFTNVASNVSRGSNLFGTQFDAAYRLNDAHTLRAGFGVSAEKTNVINMETVLPVDPNTGAVLPTPMTITDAIPLVGWNIGAYVQDEWRLTDKLTLNAGLRFDQLYQYVDANQLSPRATLTYRPFIRTSIHAGYARYFTPPLQVEATSTNLALFMNTTAQPEVLLSSPVLPERSNYFDVGVDQTVMPGLDVGVDFYYKDVKDMLEDGEFGEAHVLTQFNFAREYVEGAEFTTRYRNGNFRAYANFAYSVARAIDPVSNQYLLDADEYAYLLNHYHYVDDMQLLTGSAGASYLWEGTLFSAAMLYGSGLRSGFANIDHMPPYATMNIGVSREFQISPEDKPFAIRFDVVNLFDNVYELRDGTGIGVFAPQYGAHRGVFVGLSKKF